MGMFVLLHLLTAACGTFETSVYVRSTSAVGGNSDMSQRPCEDRF